MDKSDEKPRRPTFDEAAIAKYERAIAESGSTLEELEAMGVALAELERSIKELIELADTNGK